MDAVTVLAAESFKGQVVPIVAGIGIVFLVIGIAFFVQGLRTTRSRDAFAARAASAPGEVLDNVWRSGPGYESEMLAYPLLRYTLPDGSVVEQESFEGASPPVARRGSAVTVLYEPANPLLARLQKDGIAHSILPGALMAIGAIGASMGVLALAGAILLQIYGPDV